MITGIYKITNLTTCKSYIGSAVDMSKRWSLHRRSLRKGTHHSKYLQRSWNKRGEDNFKFEVLFTCPREDLIRLEQYCIDNYPSEYNSCKIAGSNLGIKASDETKQKLSIAMKGRVFSSESIERMRQAQRGKLFSKESRRKMANAKLGKVNPKKWKRVLQICIKTNTILNKFSSVKEASEILKIERSNISCVALGKRPNAGGFIWKYENTQN